METNSDTIWEFSAVFVEQLEASQNSNGITNFIDQYKLLRTRRPPPLFSISLADRVLSVLLTIAKERRRLSNAVSDLAIQAIETLIWIVEEQKEQSFIDALRTSIFSEEPDGKLLILLQSALSDYVTSRWNSRASTLGIHLARLLNTNFPEFFKEMGKYVPNKNAQYWIQRNLENITNSGGVQSMEESENQTMETDSNSNGTNVETVTPVPSAPPLEQISSHTWELQEMQEVQVKVLQLLSKLVNVVTVCKQKMYENEATCDSWLEIIDDQQSNVEEFQVSMLCIGSMNSGKSTCLSAISGTNVFPISDAAMTTIPSFVRCDLNQAEPVMTCKLDAFKTAIEKLKPEIFARKEQNKLRELELASKDVLDAFFGQGDLSLDLQEQVIGEVQIEKQLRVLNHLVRLCTLLGVPNPVLDIKDIKDFPTITACFPIMRNMPNFIGKLTLIDSPGPDEQKMTQLAGVVNQLLKKATVKVLVMDWQVLQGSANANIQAMVRESSSNELIGNKLAYVLVTKCDLMEEKKKSQPEEIKQGISQAIFGEKIPPERIFLVSARYGRHANMAKNFLLKNNRIPNAADGEWVPELMKDMFGSAWERVLRSLSEREFQEELDALFQKSNLIQPIEMVLRASFQQAVPNSLFFAVNKIAMISKPLMEDLQIQYKSKDIPDVKLLEYVEKMSSRMTALGELMPLLTMKKQESFKVLSEYLQFQFKQATGEVITLFQLFKENSSDILLEKMGATAEQKEIAYKLLRNNSSYLFQSQQHAYESLMAMGISVSKFVTNTIQQELSRNQDKWKSVSQELLLFIKNKINQELEGDAADLNGLFDTGLEFQIPVFSRPNLDLDDIKLIVRTVEKYEVKYPWYFLFLLPVKERVFEKRVEITAKDFQLRIKDAIDSTIDICQDSVNRYIQIYFDTEIQVILAYIDSRLAQVRQSLETALNSKIKENENQKMERARTLDFLLGELTEIKQRIKDVQRVIEHPEEIKNDGKMEENNNSHREKRKIDDQ